MITKISWSVLVFGLLVTLTGCATVNVFSSNPAMQTVSNQHFDAEFEPQQKDGQNFYVKFRIVVTNKSGKDFQVDWEKTRYLLNGKNAGRFGFEGMTFEDLDNLKTQPLIAIKAGETKSNLFFPLQLIARENLKTTTRRSGRDPINPGPLPAGKNGIRLVVVQDGKEIRADMNVTIESKLYTK